MVFQPNEDYNKMVMLYIRDNLTYRSSGKPIIIKPRHIWSCNKNCDYLLICLTVEYLCIKGLLIRQRNDVSPKATNIIGISEIGFEYIDLIENSSIRDKVKTGFSVDKFLSFVNTGLSIAEIITKLSL